MIRRATARLCWILSALWLGMGSGGCPSVNRVDMALGARKIEHSDFDEVRKRWTRSRLVIRTFDTVINASVTYMSAEFVSAYAARYARDYRLTKAERQRWLAARLAEVRAHHEFYFAVTTANPEWNDFDRKRSIWRIILEDDRGTRARPLRIKRLRVNEVHRAYFPFTSSFHRAYILTFPRTVGGKPFVGPANKFFKLSVTSPVGSANLVWYVKTDPNAKTEAPPRARPAAPERPAPARP